MRMVKCNKKGKRSLNFDMEDFSYYRYKKFSINNGNLNYEIAVFYLDRRFRELGRLLVFSPKIYSFVI